MFYTWLNALIFILVQLIIVYSRKFIVTITVRTPDGKGLSKQLKWAKDLFIFSTGAVMTGCSS